MQVRGVSCSCAFNSARLRQSARANNKRTKENANADTKYLAEDKGKDTSDFGTMAFEASDLDCEGKITCFLWNIQGLFYTKKAESKRV